MLMIKMRRKPSYEVSRTGIRQLDEYPLSSTQWASFCLHKDLDLYLFDDYSQELVAFSSALQSWFDLS